MFKKIKNKLFIVISTFLALVFSIVSFGTYRNEAKADGGSFAGFVNCFFNHILVGEGQGDPDLSNILNYSNGIVVIDRQFFGDQISNQVGPQDYWDTDFGWVLLSDLAGRIPNPSPDADLTTAQGIVEALLDLEILRLVVHVSNNNYQNMLTGDSYNNITSGHTLIQQTGCIMGDTGIYGMAMWEMPNKLAIFYRRVQQDMGAPVYTWLLPNCPLVGDYGLVLSVYDEDIEDFYNVTV